MVPSLERKQVISISNFAFTKLLFCHLRHAYMSHLCLSDWHACNTMTSCNQILIISPQVANNQGYIRMLLEYCLPLSVHAADLVSNYGECVE